jgi:hypothetical protein
VIEVFISSGVVVTTKCALEAFSMTYRPNLVSRPSSFFFRRSKVVGSLDAIFIAYALVQLSLLPPLS